MLVTTTNLPDRPSTDDRRPHSRPIPDRVDYHIMVIAGRRGHKRESPFELFSNFRGEFREISVARADRRPRRPWWAGGGRGNGRRCLHAGGRKPRDGPGAATEFLSSEDARTSVEGSAPRFRSPRWRRCRPRPRLYGRGRGERLRGASPSADTAATDVRRRRRGRRRGAVGRVGPRDRFVSH